MPSLELKPTHKVVAAYYDSLAQFEMRGIKHESAVRPAFYGLLEYCARQFDWKLVLEYAIKRKGRADAKADGVLLGDWNIVHGILEAKDSNDDLEKEIKNKFADGYPKKNILFWQPARAVLFQNGERIYEADLSEKENLVHILKRFFDFIDTPIVEWEKAAEEFKDKVPQIGASLKVLIETERATNKNFITAFDDFCSLCRGSLNPNISIEAVEEMIIQHILTERIIRKVFSAADFMQRNVIAQEIEKVITALNSKVFSRDDFSKSLQHFYGALENAAEHFTDYSEKQKFLNTVYEKFFQGFCVKIADTHGIVYTPQPLVDFMVASVEYILKEHFEGLSLASSGVHILDPFTGTGNYVVNIMRRIPKSALPHKYAKELHCNEIMLLPYYVASMNIEHTYLERIGHYESFEGICLVDTFQTAEKQQAELGIFNEKNSERVNKQRDAEIRVVIANPPYNAGQADENDNNKNRKYPQVDSRVSAFYGEGSKATLRRKLSDPYVKAIRYATDRIGESGIVCFVNNNSFITEKTFDGMRKALGKEFDLIYVLDLGGNVRKNPKLSGTTHNVFGIQVGVSINLFIRLKKSKGAERKAKIYYHAVGSDWRKEEKNSFLETKVDVDGVKWKKLEPDDKSNWITNESDEEFDSFLPIGSKDAKAGMSVPTIFRTYSLGVSTNRDNVVYDFDAKRLAKRVEQFADDYNAELNRWKTKAKPPDFEKFPKEFLKYLDDFVSYEKVKWSRNLKRWFRQEDELKFKPTDVRDSAYRPFTSLKLHYARMFVDEVGTTEHLVPTKKAEKENKILCLNVTVERPFCSLMTNAIPNLVYAGGFGCATYAFSLFTYSEDGKHKQDNVTLKARTLFQIFYDDETITQADIFHYVYAVLHHPAYRTRFAENLKRDLPRIPFVGVAAGEKDASFFPLAAVETMQGDKTPAHKPEASAKLFHALAAAGKQLADLHVKYESAPEFKLEKIENENPEVKLTYHVEAMKLAKDKSAIIYNEFLTLSGIPANVFDYKLGNRSALEWIIDQYRVTKDGDGKITSDPNRLDDEKYIVRLIGQIVTVSLETLKTVASLPEIKN